MNDLAERLDTVEEIRRHMLSDLAHELHAHHDDQRPIDAVEDGIRTPGVHTYTVIRSATGRLHRLATDLDSVSRAGERQLHIEPQPVSVAALAASAIREAQPGYDESGIVLTAGPAATDIVDADPARIGQTLANLLGNARRHTLLGNRDSLQPAP